MSDESDYPTAEAAMVAIDDTEYDGGNVQVSEVYPEDDTEDEQRMISIIPPGDREPVVAVLEIDAFEALEFSDGP